MTSDELPGLLRERSTGSVAALLELLWFHDGLGMWLDISRMHVNQLTLTR